MALSEPPVLPSGPTAGPTADGVPPQPLARLVLAQAVAAGVLGVGFWGASRGLSGGVSAGGLALWPWVAGQGLAAGALTRALGLGWGWVALQAALPGLTGAALAFAAPPWVFLLAFGLLAGTYSNTALERVPLYLTNRMTWQALDRLLADEATRQPATAADRRFIDLGAGVGGLLSHLAGRHPGWQIFGVENAPLVFAVAALRLKFGGHHGARLVFGSLWNVNLGDYDVVYAFLSPAPMPRLLAKATREMRPGTLFISNSFWADEGEGGVAHDLTVEVNDRRRTTLFVKRL